MNFLVLANQRDQCFWTIAVWRSFLGVPKPPDFTQRLVVVGIG